MQSKCWELTRDKYMSLDEVRRLRRSSQDRALADLAKGRTSAVRSWALIDLVLSTGLRVSEIAETKISDLTLTGPEPQLNVIGKGGKARVVTQVYSHITPEERARSVNGLWNEEET